MKYSRDSAKNRRNDYRHAWKSVRNAPQQRWFLPPFKNTSLAGRQTVSPVSNRSCLCTMSEQTWEVLGRQRLCTDGRLRRVRVYLYTRLARALRRLRAASVANLAPL